MLKLNRLEISGFKTFVDPVQLDFAGGLTSIVGPNGCGKSNLADAVVWVLGERSAKSLRGATMEDVIFSGAENRKPLGMAEVTLELLTPEGFPGSEDGRLSLGRRVFRSGESQYAINGKTVRLKEIRDLLMDTGLGLRSYSMIEQGKIGQILSTKPLERRRLIEEAAGVTRYKDRRRIAEVKLEEARSNLSRLDDILSEVERARRSLKRQANAALRYKEKQGEFQELQRRTLLGRWASLRGHLSTVEGEIATAVEEEAALSATLHQSEAAAAAGREELDVLARELGESHQREAELAATIEGKQEFLKGSRSRLQEIAERVAAGRAMDGARQAQLTEIRAAIERVETRRTELEAERTRAASEVDDDDQKISQIARLVSDREQRLELLRSRLLSSISELGDVRNRLHREEVEKEKGALRGRHLDEEMESNRAFLEQNATEIDDASARVSAVISEVSDFEEDLAKLQSQLADLSHRQESAAERRLSLAAELARLDQRRELLVELSRAQEERRGALREALTAAGHPEPRFLLDGLRVPEGWGETVDLYLGELSDAVVLPADASALELARTLAAGSAAGPIISRAESPDGASAPLLADPAIHTSLGQALGLAPELARALPPAYLVHRAEDAERLAHLHPGVAFLSREHLWAESGVLHVLGREARPGALTRDDELQRVRAGIPPLESSISDLVAEVAALDGEVGGLRVRSREIERELSTRRENLAVARARLEDLEGRHRRLEVERETLATERQEVDRELTLVAQRAGSLAADVERGAALHLALESDFDLAQVEVDRARQDRESTRTTGAGRRGKLDLLQERLDSLNAERARHDRELEETTRLTAQWTAESVRLEERQTEIEAAMKVADEELQTALVGRETSQEYVLAKQERLETRREEFATVEARIVVTREHRDEVRSALSEHRVRQAALKQDAEHLAIDFRGAFHEALPTGIVPLVAEERLAEMEADLERIKATLERLGPVNLLAAEEFTEQEERHTFLSAQRDDVANSVDKLKQTIREINTTSSERFLKTFNEVNENFARLFQKLFRGGEASMRLLDEDDPLDSGIEIVARPPGKRLQNLMLLSGGEKALTAIALLFALFQTKPSPFCILDEVDAPLDDINTLRFIELLKTMAHETQFVVITHNKLTMEATSRLYGVTMQERGVSKLVAVELDDVHPEPLAASA